jgi:hypothetical protein
MHDSHDYLHGHDHHHHDAPTDLPFAAKLTKRLENWHRHNEDHLGDYVQWVEEAADQGYPQVAAHLREVVEMTRQISDRIAKALAAAQAKK